jgi:MoaA/NifB/PqqE/SkfB family radical SAM enzyme
MMPMTSIREALRRLITPALPLEPGNYAYTAPPDSELPYRLHLRVDEKGEGVLIVNAATILHLNQTAAEYAYHMVKNNPPETAAERVATRYNISKQQALNDFEEFRRKIYTLIDTPDLDPISYLDFERTQPFITAEIPYRLDLAITYQNANDRDAGTAPTDRVSRELDTAEWKTVIGKAWDIGIPHIVFTGGEPTQRADLVELLEYCEAQGMVTGIISHGEKLADDAYLNQLLASGLDHLMFVLAPEDPRGWELVEKVLPLDLFTAVHLTLSPENSVFINQYLEKLASLQPNAVSLSVSDLEMQPLLEQARDYCADLGMELVWELPVPYMHLNPVTLQVNEIRVMDGAGRAWLYIEPDGDVLPDQSINRVLGNALRDPFDQILQAGRAS